MSERSPSPDFAAAFAEHRPALLRHCYRMMGSFADADDMVQEALLKAWRARSSFRGDSPLSHWLMRVSTNACLNALAKRKREGRARSLPQLERAPDAAAAPLVEGEAARWVTPAPDARLFPRADEALEARETVALAFVALLQRLPPRQRAALLLKDVVGWSADEIAAALSMTTSSVNSALHRARESVGARALLPAAPPSAAAVEAYVRAWEAHDLERLVAFLQRDVTFAMPPFASWFRGVGDVRAFLQTPRFASFWSRGLRGVITRANALPAVIWYTPRDDDGVWRLHSIQVMRFEGELVAEAVNFRGAEYLYGFDAAAAL